MSSYRIDAFVRSVEDVLPDISRAALVYAETAKINAETARVAVLLEAAMTAKGDLDDATADALLAAAYNILLK